MKKHIKSNLKMKKKDGLDYSQLEKASGGFSLNDFQKIATKAANGINKASKFINENPYANRAASFVTGGALGLAMNEFANRKR